MAVLFPGNKIRTFSRHHHVSIENTNQGVYGSHLAPARRGPASV